MVYDNHKDKIEVADSRLVAGHAEVGASHSSIHHTLNLGASHSSVHHALNQGASHSSLYHALNLGAGKGRRVCNTLSVFCPAY